MNAQQIVALGARLFALWMVTYSIRFLASAMTADQQLAGSLPFYLMALGVAVVALLVWMFPLAIANKVVPRTNGTNIIRMPARHVAALAAGTLGIWAIIESVPYIGDIIHTIGQPSFLFSPKELLYMLVSLTPLAIGLYLLKKPFAVAELILPARAAVPANVSHVDE